MYCDRMGRGTRCPLSLLGCRNTGKRWAKHLYCGKYWSHGTWIIGIKSRCTRRRAQDLARTGIPFFLLFALNMPLDDPSPRRDWRLFASLPLLASSLHYSTYLLLRVRTAANARTTFCESCRPKPQYRRRTSSNQWLLAVSLQQFLIPSSLLLSRALPCLSLQFSCPLLTCRNVSTPQIVRH
jgi:hypothetical protein